jgi:alpha-glucoside transport system substrate-binding protein
MHTTDGRRGVAADEEVHYVQRSTGARSRLVVLTAAFALLFAACGGGGGASATPGGGGASPTGAGAGGDTSPSVAATTPAGSPAEESPTDSPAAESPTGSPAEESPTGSPAGESPSGSPAAGSPSGSPAGGELPVPTFEQIGGTVTVIGTWSGSEQASFEAMVKPFEDGTGIDVQYTGTRDINAVLGSGNFPDLAGLPGPGAMAGFAKAGNLKPLDDVIDAADYRANTPPGFADIGTTDGKLYGIFIKSAVKGLIWYNPANYTGGAPADFNALNATDKGSAEALWCIGLESGAASGWPGTDWIEDIVLRQSGPDVYDRWVAGELKWTSPEIKRAYETFGTVVQNSYGGAANVNRTKFQEGGWPLFTQPPGCLFHHQASFITDFFAQAPQKPAAGTGFDFFGMPDIDPQFAGGVTGGGDLFGMFKDTPQARALIKYLATPYAQSIWVGRGGALSADRRVTNYPDEPGRKSAEILANAQTFRFDASDLMPGTMADAFNKSMVDFVRDPAQLDTILQTLDQAQEDAYGA